MRIMPHRLTGAYEGREGKRSFLLTKSLVASPQPFTDQRIVRQGEETYREWDPRRSKLAAAIVKGLQQMGLQQGSTVLYLGASHGLTPSHISDIIGESGFIIALDVAPRVVRDLVFLCDERQNMAPLLADAKRPETYAERVVGTSVDVVYQDIAQKEQVEIFVKNCDAFLKKGGFGLLAVKARSIDVTKRPLDIFKGIKRQFESVELAQRYVIVDYRELDPFEKDHALFVVKKR